LVGNALASRARFAKAFGVSPQKLLPEILRRLRTKPEFTEVSREEAPVQEVVATGADVDLTKLPVHLQHGKDGGPFISAAMDFARDAATGWTNVGLRRLMLRGRVFHVTAITRRRDALFQTLTIGGATMSRTDTAQLACLRTEVLIWRALETAVREPVNVYAPAATGGTMNVRIAMRQRVPGEARAGAW